MHGPPLKAETQEHLGRIGAQAAQFLRAQPLDAAPAERSAQPQYPQRLGRPSAGHQQAGGSED